MMTEPEAGRMWCPFARVARIETIGGSAPQAVVGGTNRDALGGRQTRPVASCCCLGSQCMAWRWEYDVEEKLDTKGRRTGRQIASVTNRGFCGLAGRPGPNE